MKKKRIWIILVKNIKIEKYKNCEKDDDNDSDYTDISFGRLECHEEFSLKKIPKELTYIPKLKINNINKDNKNNI